MLDINSTVSSIAGSYSSFVGNLPPWGQAFMNIFLILVVVLLYLLFVRGFYSSVSKKDILGLNLNQYNKTQLPFANLVFKSLLFFVEYLVIIPFVVFFWFSILALFLLVLTNISTTNILLVAAIVVLAARVTSYFKKSVSENVAKLLPFNLLAIALLTPNFFKFDVIIGHFQSIPSLLGQIIIYLVFIIAFEILMRAVDFIISLFDISFEEKAEKEQAKNTPLEAVLPSESSANSPAASTTPAVPSVPAGASRNSSNQNAASSASAPNPDETTA